ncbi:PhzF family phenazine biosynthesis protein [Rhodococcus spongiicola]|uniref:PhzF family phenazine biosynthesis protein n=1 Tax=Rhodococcus spongiicola TaxID=2487352 RepID=A0A438AXU6_9NOCA|nr:PhzF family phenazine biosynthesis isomerase [Rhodococcus spongiicola]RVW03531.1 PhzF family phenazine biosynthesis protein [Rhodococcus spongiicola]
MTIDVHVVRVFTDSDGKHGNPLGIVDAAAVDESERQAIAKRLGFSETVFVEMPEPGAHTVRARIFTPMSELPFAGHPTVGLTWWLDQNGFAVEAIEVPAGRVEICIRHGAAWVRTRPEWAPDFALHPMQHVNNVKHARAQDFTDGQHYIWAWEDELEGRIRSRMFAPKLGITEDEATGSAAVRITAHLRRSLLINQGRGSRIHTKFDADGWVEIGGLVHAEHTITI